MCEYSVSTSVDPMGVVRGDLGSASLQKEKKMKPTDEPVPPAWYIRPKPPFKLNILCLVVDC